MATPRTRCPYKEAEERHGVMAVTERSKPEEVKKLNQPNHNNVHIHTYIY